MSSHVQKELETLKAIAKDQGWSVVPTGTNHLQWRSPEGHCIHGSGSTPSDWRGVKNLRSVLKRNGLRLPRKDGRIR